MNHSVSNHTPFNHLENENAASLRYNTYLALSLFFSPWQRGYHSIISQYHIPINVHTHTHPTHTHISLLPAANPNTSCVLGPSVGGLHGACVGALVGATVWCGYGQAVERLLLVCIRWYGVVQTVEWIIEHYYNRLTCMHG